MSSEYNAVHRAARKLRQERCEKCGDTERLDMALRPGTPRHRLRYEPAKRLWYSVSVHDYVTLCRRCHVRQDAAVRYGRDGERRVKRACRSAARCNVCDQPMLVGQRGTHLSCRQPVPSSRP
jgi:hypothetical protein